MGMMDKFKNMFNMSEEEFLGAQIGDEDEQREEGSYN